MKKLFILIAILLYSTFANSQNWQTLDMGVNEGVASIFCDSVDTMLYVTGSLISNASGIPVNQVARWNGAAWDSVPNSYNRFIFPIGRYNGELYAEDMNLTTFSYCISKWNGSSWIPFAYPSGGVIGKIFQEGTDMYAIGSFDSINGIAASKVAKFDGSSWSAIDTTKWGSGGGVNSAVFYNGDLYIAGSIWNWDNSILTIAKWNGSSWVALGSGIMGPLAYAKNLVVYQGELYASGSFLTNYGNADYNIQRWDGSTWKAVGGGVTGSTPTSNGQINGMIVYDNKIYVAGIFQYAGGGVPARYIASWDGTNWCSSGAQPGSPLQALGILNNELYVGINSDDTLDLNYIAKWIGGPFSDSCTANVASIYETDQTLDASVYPNPADEEVNIEFHAELNDVSLRIQNIIGQQMYFKEVKPKEMQVKIDIRNFPSGVYIISVLNDSGMTTRKFIKH